MAAQVLEGLYKPAADRLAEVEEAGFSLRLDAQKGAALRMEVSPRKDSKLAAMVGKSVPYTLDARTLPGFTAVNLMIWKPKSDCTGP